MAESAIVGKPDQVNMEVVKAFIALKPGFQASKELELDIMNFIRKKLSALAMPQEIEFVPGLPKTRSGKIIRRVLRAREFSQLNLLIDGGALPASSGSTLVDLTTDPPIIVRTGDDSEMFTDLMKEI